MNSLFEQKVKHAYECYLNGIPRRKVYAVIEKGDKFIVGKFSKPRNYKYFLAGGGIEEGEDVITACIRECSEELNVNVEFVNTLDVIRDKSTWNYNGFEFEADDEMNIVYTKFVSYAENNQFGIDGEFDTQDVYAEITREEMLSSVAEFAHYGVELE